MNQRQSDQLRMRRRVPGVYDAMYDAGCGRPIIQSGQAYSLRDCVYVEDWLLEREAGYPMRDLPWPTTDWDAEPGAYPWYAWNDCGREDCCKDRR